MIGNLSVTHTNTMKMKVNSNYGYFNSFYFYLGWRNVHRAPLTQLIVEMKSLEYLLVIFMLDIMKMENGVLDF
jgi:hypothetical protein